MPQSSMRGPSISRSRLRAVLYVKHVPLLQTLERQTAARRSLRWRPSRALGQGNRLQVHSLHSAIPEAQGLYDPANDKDACGVGFIGRPCVSEGCCVPLHKAPASASCGLSGPITVLHLLGQGLQPCTCLHPLHLLTFSST